MVTFSVATMVPLLSFTKILARLSGWKVRLQCVLDNLRSRLFDRMERALDDFLVHGYGLPRKCLIDGNGYFGC